MTIEFSYQKNQVIQALRYHFLSKREIRTMIIAINVFALASAALFYFRLIKPLAFLVGTFLWFGLMMAFWFVLPWLVYRRAATFQDRFTMNLNDSSFTVSSGAGSRSWTWDAVSNIVETPNFFHLYFDTRSFFLVPKQAFNGSEGVFEFRHLLKEKVTG